MAVGQNESAPNPDAPAGGAVAVTPDNSNDLAIPARALYVGTGGNINLDTAQGDTVVFTSVPSGSILPVRAKRVRATSTTASNIVALY